MFNKDESQDSSKQPRSKSVPMSIFSSRRRSISHPLLLRPDAMDESPKNSSAPTNKSLWFAQHTSLTKIQVEQIDMGAIPPSDPSPRRLSRTKAIHHMEEGLRQ